MRPPTFGEVPAVATVIETSKRIQTQYIRANIPETPYGFMLRSPEAEKYSNDIRMRQL
jgi:hypothetical protein